MPHALQTDLLSAEAAVAQLRRLSSPNGLRYATLGVATGANDAPHTTAANLARLVQAVPANLAASLQATTYAFVPLALSAARLDGNDAADAAFQSNDRTLIAPAATPELTDLAICHRNAEVQGADFVFLSSLLHNDNFALAFEFFINIAHDLVDIAGMPASFGALLTEQVNAGVRGETSIDAWEHRTVAYGPQPGVEVEARSARARSPEVPPTQAARDRAQRDYQQAAFADATAVYLLSLFLDFDYADLREREYPLLAPTALAARLRAVNALYPPNEGYSFQVLYRRRG